MFLLILSLNLSDPYGEAFNKDSLSKFIIKRNPSVGKEEGW